MFSLSITETVTAGSPELSRTRLARRLYLLKQAQELFLRDGYNATTMERIAQDADVSKATLYKYFSDKDELFVELVKEGLLAPNQRLLDELHKTVAQTLAQLKRRGGREEVAQAILRLLKTSAGRRNDVFYRILIEIAFVNPPLLQRVRREILANKTSPFLALTAEAAAALPSELDGQALMQLLFLTIHGYTLIGDVVFGDVRLDPERLASTFATLICSALD